MTQRQDQPTVAIVGGGITGLTAAHTLLSDASDVKVIILEAADRLGGKLRSIELEGARLEAGADSFLIREPFALVLCEDLGLEDELIEPAVFGGLVWGERGARPLPTGAVMGVPTSPGNLMRSTAVPLRGRMRGLWDVVLSGPLEEEDVAVGPYLRRRFGRAVVETMVDPILAGTRAGDPDELSLRFAMPQVYRAAKTERSVMKGLRLTIPAEDTRPRFNAPRGGMAQLVSALAHKLERADVRTSSSVTSVARNGAGFEVVTGGQALEVDAVLITSPAAAAAKMLSRLAPSAASELANFAYASVASIGLAYRRGALSFPPGSSGFLVPSRSERLLNAGTWWSLKWPHTAADRDIVRCFVGRAGRHPALDLDDEELARRAAGEIGDLLHTSERPIASSVDRWEDGLPQYRVGHADRMRLIEGALAEHPGIELAGADLRGTGIPDCVRQGAEAARRIIGHLNDKGTGLESPEGTIPERKEER